MDIIAELKSFDGKHTDVLENLAMRLSPDASVIQNLCAIAKHDEAKLQTGATWVLKRFQENEVSFAPAQVESCLTLLDLGIHWEAKLHLLQMLPGFAIPPSQKDSLYIVLKHYLKDTHKFVRAWSYNGLFELAAQYSEFRGEVTELLKVGQQEEAASVRARIRNILSSQVPCTRL